LPQDPRWNEAHEAERLSAANAALHAVEMAYAWARRSVYYECAVAPGTDATSAPGAVGRQAAEALRRAFAAGLWAFWVRDAEVVAVPAPNLHSDGRNQLHRIGGPAIEWPGEGYWFIEGGQVPPGALEIPREALAEGMTLMERWAVAQAVGVILLLWICYMFFFR
jgi:hypothetical protein